MGRTPSNKILDAGVEKYLGDIIMEPQHVTDFKIELERWRALYDKMNWWSRSFELWRQSRDVKRPDIEQFKSDERQFSQMPPIFDTYIQYTNIFPFRKITDNQQIAEYMGISPFYPSVMINISPNWKGRFTNYKGEPLRDAFDVRDFKAVIEKYLTSNNRYTKWKYCLECGSEGNFLHAHIVAEINPKCYKSVITHINKGNHSVELSKHWDKIDRFPKQKTSKGMEGLLKGKFAVQRVLIRNREILRDKLQYLLEENKPEGHHNLCDLGKVYGDF